MLYRHTNHQTRRALVAGLALLVLSGTGLTAQAQSNRRTARMESGTVLPVVLENGLTSNKSHKGDRFTAKLRTDGGSYSGLPEGTRLEGVVTEARPKTDSKTPGILDLKFQRLRLPDGNAYAIDSELIPLDDKNVETREDGRMVAKPGAKRDDMKYVGYGAAAGALISILGNRGRLSIENILLGGLAGYAAGALTKGPQEARDVNLKPGTEVGVRLTKPLRFVTNGDTYIPDEDRAPRNPVLDRDPNLDRDRILDEDMTSDFSVMLDNRNVNFRSNRKPFQSGSVWMLPLTAMLPSDADVERSGANRRTLRVNNGDITITGTVGSNVAIVNGERHRLSKPLRLMNGEIYAPVDFFEFATNTRSRFDRDTNTLVFIPSDRY